MKLLSSVFFIFAIFMPLVVSLGEHDEFSGGYHTFSIFMLIFVIDSSSQCLLFVSMHCNFTAYAAVYACSFLK